MIATSRVLAVTGTLTLDTTAHGDVTYVDVPGGSALYAAAAGSVLLPTRIIGSVGLDFPFSTLDWLWSRDVDASAIERLEGRTFRWHAKYDQNGERVTLWRDLGVAADRLPPVDTPNAAPGSTLFLGSMNPRIQAHVLDSYPSPSLVGLDSMAHWWAERPDELHALLRRVDVVFVDETELMRATGSPGVAGVEQLLAQGPRVVVVKRGARGAVVYRAGVPAVSTSAVVLPRTADPTGAGDAFAGAFLAACASTPEDGDLYALRFATAVASFAVEGIGIDGLAAASLDTVRQRMRALAVGQP